MRPFARQLCGIAQFALLGAACSTQAPVHLQPSVSASDVVDVAQLDRSFVNASVPGICAHPKVHVGNEPATPVFATKDRLFVPGTPVVSGALDAEIPEGKSLCEWSADLELVVDCTGQRPIGTEDEEGSYADPRGHTSFLLEKRLIPAEVFPERRTGVSPWTTLQVRFPSTAISGPVPLETIRIANVAGSLTSGSWGGESFVTFVPDEPLVADTEYTVTLAGGAQGPRNSVGGCLGFLGEPSQTFTFRTRPADQPAFRLEAIRQGSDILFFWDEIPGASVAEKVSKSDIGYAWARNGNSATYQGSDACVTVTATLAMRSIESNEVCTKDLR